MDQENGCVECACECAGSLENAWKILTASKEKNFVAVQISPAVRVSIGEKFGLARGEDGAKKVVAALEMLGADVVVDTAIASDMLTLVKLQQVLANKEEGKDPVYSSECSAWVAHAKERYPEIELLPTATTVCAKLLKKYYSEMYSEKTVRVIALEMGDAKKCDSGVDVVLTLDELGVLLNGLETNVRLLKKKPLTAPLGCGSGASYIAAASGGDAEALARCLTDEKNQLNYRKFEYSGLYGKGLRKATLILDGKEWKFAVADCLDAADELMAAIAAGETYDYVEITACAGGQIGLGCDLETEEGEMTRRLRKLGLKYLDQGRVARSADMNPAAAALLKSWNSLCRSGEADTYDVIEEIVKDVEEVVEEVAEETPVEEIVEEIVEEAPVEEVVEEIVEEAPVEEIVEEVAEEAPVEEVVEEVAEEAPVEEVVEEVAEEAPVEEVAEEAPVEEVVEEVVEEAPVEEIVEEVAEEAPVEEIVEEVAEEAPVEEVVEEVAEEAPVEEIVEEVVEEAPVEEVVEEVAKEAPVEEITEDVLEEEIEEALEVFEEAIQEELAESAEVEETEVAEEVALTETEETLEETVEEVVEEPVVEEVAQEIPEEEPADEIEQALEVFEDAIQEELAQAQEPVIEVEEDSEEEEESEGETAEIKRGGRLSTKDRRKLKRKNKKAKNNKK